MCKRYKSIKKYSVSCLTDHTVSLRVCMCVHNNYTVIELSRSSMSGHYGKWNLTRRSPNPWTSLPCNTIRTLHFVYFFRWFLRGYWKQWLYYNMYKSPLQTRTHILVVGHAALQSLVDERDRLPRSHSYVFNTRRG